MAKMQSDGPYMKGKRVASSIYLDPEKKQQLDALSDATRVPASTYLREAVDDLLIKYAKELKRAKR